jgi:hypothetical protein
MKPIKPAYVMVGILFTLAVAWFVCAFMDWIVTNWVNNPYVSSPARTQFNNQYGTLFSLVMLSYGIVSAVAILLVSRSRLTSRIAGAVVFASVVFWVASLEDWLYFTIGYFFYGQPYPGWSVQWSWMGQSQTVSYWLGWNGSWTTVNMLAWTLVWLFIILPIGLVTVFKLPKVHR